MRVPVTPVSLGLLLTVLLVALAGCASAPQQPQSYLLYPPDASQGVSTHDRYDIGLRRITVAPYLHRDGILVETAEHQLREAQGHRWAEPLAAGLRRLLQHDLALAAEQPVAARIDRHRPRLVIDVSVSRFHGTEDGRVTLVADWTVTEDGQLRRRSEFVRQRTTTRDGYDALVAAHIALSADLAQAIAESLSP